MNRRIFFSVIGAIALIYALSSCQLKQNRPPNILICIADDASFAHMGANGCTWIKTPGIDRIANEGIRFRHSYTPNAKCAPSRACLLTGRNSWQLEEAANHVCYFPNKFKTFFEALREHGYFTGYTAKGWAPGIVGKIAGKERQLTGTPYNNKTITPPADYISDNDYAGNFQDFLNDKPENQSFCFWYGGREPHRPYEYGAGTEKGGKKISVIDRMYDFFPDNEVTRQDILDYAYEIEYFDLHTQKILQLLEEHNELENTIVIVTSDHGMPFPRIKGQAYDYSNHVPLAIMWKNGINYPGRTVDDFVNFIDIAPTLLEAAQVTEKQSGMQPIEGKSLMDILKSSKSGLIDSTRDHVLIGKERHDIGRPHDWGYPIRGIINNNFLYLINFKSSRWPAGNPETGYANCDGGPTKTEILELRRKGIDDQYWQQSFGKRPEEELYSLKGDPDCVHNLADDKKFQSLKENLKNQMFDELKAQGDPRMFGKGYIFDEYKYAFEEHRNLYERYIKGERPKMNWLNPSDFEKK
jgi:arylsulfatase A-like enzyme